MKAEWIAWQLEESGYTVIFQPWDFRPGGNFVRDMDRGIFECERTIAVLSPDFLKSEYTIREWTAALLKDPSGEKRLLLPVRVRDCESVSLLGTITYIDLLGKTESEAKKALLDGVKSRGKPPMAPVFGPSAVQKLAQTQHLRATDCNIQKPDDAGTLTGDVQEREAGNLAASNSDSPLETSRVPSPLARCSNDRLWKAFGTLLRTMSRYEKLLKESAVDPHQGPLMLAYPKLHLPKSKEDAIAYVKASERMMYFVGNHSEDYRENYIVHACSGSLLEYFRLKGNSIVRQPIWEVVQRLLGQFLRGCGQVHQSIITQQLMYGLLAEEGLYQFPEIIVRAIRNSYGQPQAIEPHILSDQIFSEDGRFLGTLAEYKIKEIDEYTPRCSPTPQQLFTWLVTRNRAIRGFLRPSIEKSWS